MAMDLKKVAPELRDATRAISRMPMPLGSKLGRTIIRKLGGLAPASIADGVSVEYRADPGVHVFRPGQHKSDGALLWIHGGGYLIGSPKQDYGFCSSVAADLGIVVVAAAYRLSPEHPFPAPLDDCHRIWAWLLETAPTLGVDPANIAIGGQSAGGGLAAGLVQRVHDEGGIQPAAQLLLSPMIDDRTAADRDLDTIGHRLWHNRLNRLGWRSYLGREPGADSQPDYAVPARRDHVGGLAPTWIGVGDIDLFAEEDRRYAERLRAAGVPTEFVTVPGAPHGFEAWAAESNLATSYLAKARRWLADRLARPA